MNQLKVCLVVPAYNEELAIGKVVIEARNAFTETPYEVDIVVVNDSSTDQTAEKAHVAGATVISHIINSGAGGATSTGLRYAHLKSYDIAATMDADGQHDPHDVIKGINLLNSESCKADLLIGSRLIDSRGMSKVKILGNKGLSMMTKLLFNISVTDSQSGLRIFSSRALSDLKWETSGYEFCSEMLWRANQLHMKTEEYPIKAIYTDYSKSKGQSNWNAINILKSLASRRIMELLR